VGFISYDISGLRLFLFLSIPIVAFLAFHIFGHIKHAEKMKRSRPYYIASKILIIYVFIFFVYMLLGLRFLDLLRR